MKVPNENMKDTRYNSSILILILSSNIVEPCLTFVANSRNKACESEILSELEGVHVPSKTLDYKMVKYTLTSGFLLICKC